MRLVLVLAPGVPPAPVPVEAVVLMEPTAWGTSDVATLRGWAGAPRLYARLDAGADGLDAATALGLDGIVAPVADARAAGRWAARIAVSEAEAGQPDGATRLLAVIGTAQAALEVARIAGAGPRLAGLAFDGGALARGLGLACPPLPEGADAPPSPALAQARGLVLLAAAAHRLPAWEILPAGASTPVAAAARRDGFTAVVTPDPALARRLAGDEPG